VNDVCVYVVIVASRSTLC